ncbi:universal stress protein [Humibacillus xanthopallidus]|uniref:universal stress protein n=1 Tax=Humibacillus xanthopallidus TaxID=412689 RepID=UPI0038513437
MNGQGTDRTTVTTENPTEAADAPTADESGRHHTRTAGVVIGYDGSPESRLALSWAAATARRRGSRLTLLHSVNLSFIPGFPAFDTSQVEPELQDAAKRLVDDGAMRAGDTLDASRIQTQYWLGSPAAQIVEASHDAELVVMGSRGRGRITGGLLGSTSYAVAAHAHCPVVVVRPSHEAAASADAEVPETASLSEGLPEVVRPDATHPVVVGFDDSEPALRAVQAAADIAMEEGAELRIAHVVQVPSIDSWAYEETAHAGTVHAHSLREHADDALSAAVRLAKSKHLELKVSTEVLYGDPGQAIADLGRTAGLVVVGSRGRGGFKGLLLGSVSHNVIHNAECPVMVVR